ncbi:MAG: serine/threonine protein kinase [Ktedonobacteraceae bacterium]
MEPERLGKYELLERLGRGGMGEVWKARDTGLRRYVAIKLLNAAYQDKSDFVTHFMREAQLVASLHHPNIVQIHDFQLINAQDSGSKAYMVMDYVEGGTLAGYIRETVRKGLLPPAADIVYLFTAVGLALDYAHQRGMIHRDIKPENILLDKSTSAGRSFGEPILTDFGIARLQGTSSSTLTNAWLGTPHYMSPEQAEGHAVNERSDLYSLGIVLYEILTGITPFRGEGPIAIIIQHMFDKPTPPDLINPKVTPALSAVVLRSIAKDPEARFPSASAMTIALAQAFDLPVPASLGATRHIPEQSHDNPLQPSRVLPGSTPPQLPTLASPAPFIPATANYAEQRVISPSLQSVHTPAHLTPATGDYARNGGSPPFPQKQPRPRRRTIYIALIACMIVLLVGISAFAVLPRLFHSNTVNTPDVVVGSIVFSSSQNTSHITFDQMQIDLKNIPNPPSNTTYYAWLESANTDALFQHWQLSVSNGTIHGLYTSSPPANLLTNTTTFLITEEVTSAASPVTPNPIPGQHLYYAAISPASSAAPTFEVRQCPPLAGSGNAGNQWCA